MSTKENSVFLQCLVFVVAHKKLLPAKGAFQRVTLTVQVAGFFSERCLISSCKEMVVWKHVEYPQCYDTESKCRA